MTIEEIRELFKNSVTYTEYESNPGKFGFGGELFDPYYDVLNMAWTSLENNGGAYPVKVGDYTVELLDVRLHASPEKNVDSWVQYKDALCTAIFMIAETGDRFKVTGENGSWGWGVLMETELSQIEEVTPFDLGIDNRYVTMQQKLDAANRQIERLEVKIREMNRDAARAKWAKD